MKIPYLLACLALVVFLVGCTTIRETQPTQTAREQLILSAAADHASARIDPELPADSRIFVDTSHFGTTENNEYRSQYAINAIRGGLLRRGYRLTDDPSDADVIAEVSSGALSIDRREQLLGLPSATVPIPFSGPLETPELAIWKSKRRTGVAKFLLSFYDADTGAIAAASEPVYGFSHANRSSILFYGRTYSDVMPPDAEKRHDGNAK